jgi:chaperone modulatory protein CbpM
MTIESVHALFLEQQDALSLADLVELSGLSEGELVDLVECGAFAPFDPNASSWTFSARCVVVARTAHRLREDFALDDTHALAVLLRFAQRIEELERQIEALRARR